MKLVKITLNSMNESLEGFAAQLMLSKSKLTASAYKGDVERFIKHIQENSKIKKLSALKPQHIVEYLGSCKANGKSDATVTRYYMSLKSFCKYLKRNKMIDSDMMEDIAAPKNNLKAPRIPTVDEICQLLDQPDPSTEAGLRDRAMMELLYSSGLRASELCDLQVHQIGPRNVLISCGKRGKTRTIPVTAEAFAWVDRYITQYRGTEKGPLFLTIMGKGLTRQLLSKIVGRHAKAAGIEEVTAHTLRHACATHLMNSGADLRLIQEVLGHSTIASTQRYTHLSSSKMEEMFTHYHPRKATTEQPKPYNWEVIQDKEDDDERE